jgi:hypothetical protein
MQRNQRWIVVAVGLAALIGLFVVLRPRGSPTSGATPSPGRTVSPSPEPTVTGPSPTPSPTGEPRTVIRIRFEVGEVIGPDRVEVRRGSLVSIVVRADVEEEVHLHGYDLSADVGPERPARIDFRARVPGVFECELEHSGRLLFHLEVSP